MQLMDIPSYKLLKFSIQIFAVATKSDGKVAKEQLFVVSIGGSQSLRKVTRIIVIEVQTCNTACMNVFCAHEFPPANSALYRI